MTDRKTASTITDEELDELYNDLDRYEELQGEMNERAIDLTRRAARAEAAIARVRALHQPVGVVAATEFGNPPDCAICGPNTWPCPTYNAITDDQPTPTAATPATDWQQQNDGTWTLPIRNGAGILTVPASTTADERARLAVALSNRAADEPPLAIPHDTATTLHRTLGQLLGDEDAQAIARLRKLHREEYGSCAECTSVFSVSYPCPTIRAIDGKQPDA